MTNDRPTECINQTDCSIVLRPGEQCPVCDGVRKPDPHLAAYAKGLEDAATVCKEWGESIGNRRGAQEQTMAAAALTLARRIRALSPLPPGTRVVVVPPEGSEERERAMARGMDASYRAVGSCGLNSEHYLKLRLTYAIAAALRALTGGDDRD